MDINTYWVAKVSLCFLFTGTFLCKVCESTVCKHNHPWRNNEFSNVLRMSCKKLHAFSLVYTKYQHTITCMIFLCNMLVYFTTLISKDTKYSMNLYWLASTLYLIHQIDHQLKVKMLLWVERVHRAQYSLNQNKCTHQIMHQIHTRQVIKSCSSTEFKLSYISKSYIQCTFVKH